MEAIDSHGHSALHWACQRGDLPLLSLLLDKGANPNQPDQARDPTTDIRSSNLLSPIGAIHRSDDRCLL